MFGFCQKKIRNKGGNIHRWHVSKKVVRTVKGICKKENMMGYFGILYPEKYFKKKYFFKTLLQY